MPQETPISLDGARIVVFGGTGSLGQQLVSRILSGERGLPEKLLVVSRDEAKQYQMKLDFEHRTQATQEILYRRSSPLDFFIGDIRDFSSVEQALHGADYVFNAAALKQVPTCEYFPFEAVQTNCTAVQNIIRAVNNKTSAVKAVVGISTDKACKPVNAMGMTKALQERMLVQANLHSETRFGAVRYGNVLASRGSVIPLFLEQISRGGPVTITTESMTRFLLTLDQAVDTVFAWLDGAQPGEIYVPRIPAARIIDLARAMIGERPIRLEIKGIRPGEKEHEQLISDEESYRTILRSDYYVILPMLPELQAPSFETAFSPPFEYSSHATTLSQAEITALLEAASLLPPPLNETIFEPGRMR